MVTYSDNALISIISKQYRGRLSFQAWKYIIFQIDLKFGNITISFSPVGLNCVFLLKKAKCVFLLKTDLKDSKND